MNLWRRDPRLETNPYARTAFRVGRVKREVVSHRALVTLIGQTRRVAEAGEHSVAGRTISVAEVQAVESLLLNPGQRIGEELLEHASEKPPVEPLKKLAREAAEALAGDDAPLEAANFAVLRTWAPLLTRQFLESLPAPEVSFGALELELPPPFGRPEVED